MHNNLSAELQSQMIKEIGAGTLARAGRRNGRQPACHRQCDWRPPAVPQPHRDHRVKVQFHWQRGTSSHSRLQHPAAGSHTGASAEDSAGTWVRVAAPLAPVAGANWGAGASDATGNAPAWFPGEAAAHAQPAVLSGLKSQAMAASQGGSGAYSQLVFDDSAGQPRIGLQRHAGAHLGTAERNLGALRQQSGNERLKPVGFGLELKTEHATALRAGRGMLLSADIRTSGQGTQLDALEAHQQIDAGAQLQTALATTVQQHTVGVAGDGAAEPAPEKLPAGEEFLAKTP